MISIPEYLLFDGATGTYYTALTKDRGSCESANLHNPHVIEQIHKEYIKAGSMAIKTNTFGANTYSMEYSSQEVEQIIQAGYAIACRAAQEKALVFCDIGPIFSDDDAGVATEYRRIADLFLSMGADQFLLETFPDYDRPLELAKYIKLKKPEATVFVSFAVDADGCSVLGVFAKEMMGAAKDCDAVDGYGFNCVCGPGHLCDIVRANPPGEKPMLVMPNSGYPSRAIHGFTYNPNYDYFADKLCELYSMGVKILGGCCGTTPEHIHHAAQALKGGVSKKTVFTSAKGGQSTITKSENSFQSALVQQKKVVVVELDPPFNANAAYLIESAKLLKEAGADLISVADSPLARARADSVMMAAKIKREAGVDTLCHLTCRDRNLVGLKSAVLGGYIEGIRNFLAITGDPVNHSTAAGAKGVFDLNSHTLLGFFDGLNQELFSEDPIFAGAALNINAHNLDHEIIRAEKKGSKQAQYFLTQPVFGQDCVNRLRQVKAVIKRPVIVGIMPLISYKNAQFINNEVPGITINKEIIECFQGKEPAEARAIGVELSKQLIDVLYDDADGFFLIPSLKKLEGVCELTRYIIDKNKQ